MNKKFSELLGDIRSLKPKGLMKDNIDNLKNSAVLNSQAKKLLKKYELKTTKDLEPLFKKLKDDSRKEDPKTHKEITKKYFFNWSRPP